MAPPKNLDSLKQEVSMDEHKVPLDELCQRLQTDQISVGFSLCVFLLITILKKSHKQLINYHN